MMALPNYGDQRMVGRCIYCGGLPETREHVPSKVFLDQPFPEDLPVVEACESCNNGFSSDEEYMACLIDCVISGSTEPNRVSRSKIAKILARRPAIANRIASGRSEGADGPVFSVETERVQEVVEKIARGHVLFEMNELVDSPLEVWIRPLVSLGEDERSFFEDVEGAAVGLWPEVGSRAMQRLIVEDSCFYNGWIHVQQDRYRYSVSQTPRLEVRMVFSEYLACRVLWD